MKILYYFAERETLMYQWQRFHIFNELSFYGVEIEVFNPLDYYSVSESNVQLINKVKGGNFDLFMTPLNEEFLYIDTLKKIKKSHVPTLLICHDNLVVPFYHKNICKYFDLVWITSQETERLFNAWGANTIFLPYAANPILFAPSDSEENESFKRVCFVGTPYGSRVNMLNHLVSSGIYVDLYSNFSADAVGREYKQGIFSYLSPFTNLIRTPYGRKIICGAIKQKLSTGEKLLVDSDYISLNRPVPLDSLSKVYNRYSLCLSSTAARNTGVLKNPLNIINLRSFEIPMSGGIQFCKYNEELSNYFLEDKEIIFYHNQSDYIEKARFYTSNESYEERKLIKLAARNRAISEHSWAVRFRSILDRLGLSHNL